jgi:hypothetical protein
MAGNAWGCKEKMGRTGARAINHQHGGRGPKASISKKKASITHVIHKLPKPFVGGEIRDRRLRSRYSTLPGCELAT